MLPVGAFLIDRCGQRLVLVDAGLGPDPAAVMAPMSEYFDMTGGALLDQLELTGHALEDVTDVVVTHLHADHHGWLTNDDRGPAFPAARVWVGQDDYDYFVRDQHTSMFAVVRERLRRLKSANRLELVRNAVVTPGVSVRHAPGHTPGHQVVVLDSSTKHIMLLGDAMTCPIQLGEPAWHSMGDVDPQLAEATREALWRELEKPDTVGVGAHFPHLGFGRVETAGGRSWVQCAQIDGG
jgi:glyoxylase-like metal-dependent hydrolase (beta-lactamase superfamily II)